MILRDTVVSVWVHIVTGVIDYCVGWLITIIIVADSHLGITCGESRFLEKVNSHSIGNLIKCTQRYIHAYTVHE